MLTDKKTRIKKLEAGILKRKKLGSILKECYYALLFLIPIFFGLYFLFSTVNTVVYWYLIGGLTLSTLFVVKCYLLIRRFDKEGKALRTELYRIQKL